MYVTGAFHVSFGGDTEFPLITAATADTWKYPKQTLTHVPNAAERT